MHTYTTVLALLNNQTFYQLEALVFDLSSIPWLSLVPCLSFLPCCLFCRVVICAMLSFVSCCLLCHVVFCAVLSFVPCCLLCRVVFCAMLYFVPCCHLCHVVICAMLSFVPCCLLFSVWYQQVDRPTEDRHCGCWIHRSSHLCPGQFEVGSFTCHHVLHQWLCYQTAHTTCFILIFPL